MLSRLEFDGTQTGWRKSEWGQQQGRVCGLVACEARGIFAASQASDVEAKRGQVLARAGPEQ
jgi:hypothetical protein